MPAFPVSIPVRRLAGALLLVLLAACGGGGGGGDADGGTAAPGTTSTTPATTSETSNVDVYVGNWVACFMEGGGSMRESLVITRTSDTSLTFTFTGQRFASTDCSGTAQSTDSGTGTATLTGKKTVGTEVADKVQITEGNVTDKDLLAVRADGKLYVGRDADSGGTVDADGYPNTFDTDPFTRAS